GATRWWASSCTRPVKTMSMAAIEAKSGESPRSKVAMSATPTSGSTKTCREAGAFCGAVAVCLLSVPQAEHSSTIHTRKVTGSLAISFLLVLRELSTRLLLNVDLVDFDNGRSSKSREVWSKLLLIGTTRTCLHMGLSLPHCDQEAFVVAGIGEIQHALESLLLSGQR